MKQEELEALLARLEAAERFAMRAYATAQRTPELDEAYDVWRKAVGKQL
jgi:hypothetical protein